jgi:pectin methylesterase-like acyl-CoA thioesterase
MLPVSLGLALALAMTAAACAAGDAPGAGAGGRPSDGLGGAGTGGATGGPVGTGGSAMGGRNGAAGVGAGGSGAGAGGARDAGAADVPASGAGGRGGAAGVSGAGTGGRAGAGGGDVSLPAGVSGLFPAPGAQGLCADPPLRITFPAAPALGTAGRIQVFDAAQPATAVATVDMAVATTTDTIGGTLFNVPRPVFVDGNAVIVGLRQHALTYGQTYYVTVDAGAIRPAGGATLAITGTTAWRFTTAAAAPTNRAAIGVALDGSQPFCSVQGAIDLLPTGSTAATITIAAGTYHEIVRFSGKNNLTLRGADRAATIIAATNNNNVNAGTSTRSLVTVNSSSGLVIENLTIHNLTPQGGSQAEALRLQCDQCVVRNANVLSLQDTLLFDGRIYVDNSLIAGNVDFVWGGGVAYFNNCEIRTAGRAGVNVQARNAVGAYGYVFVDCKLTSDPANLTNNALARIDAGVYPGSAVAYVNCTMGPHISAAGWTIDAGTPTASLHFWEYQSRTPAGALVDVSRRVAGVQISAAQATMLRTPSIVLAGWTPPAN